jgi:putative protease
MSGIRIGEVTHFYDRIGVAVIILSGAIRLGDQVHFLGRSTDFKQEVKSLQIEHQPISEAGSGQE